jgi:hypothetical protein
LFRVAGATAVLKSVRGPTAAILSFASPKESIQRKGDPDAALILRSSLLNGVAERGFPAPSSTRCIPASPLWAIPFKSSGAQRGIKGENPVAKSETV